MVNNNWRGKRWLRVAYGRLPVTWVLGFDSRANVLYLFAIIIFLYFQRIGALEFVDLGNEPKNLGCDLERICVDLL